MKIGVASQNRRSVTAHLGLCRRFLVFDVEKGAVSTPQLVELTKDETLHAISPDIPSPLQGLDVLICGGMGSGMQERLRKRGIAAIVTTCEDPAEAVRGYLGEASGN